MSAGTPQITVFSNSDKRKSFNQTLTANNDVSDWVRCMGDIAVQITGSATSVAAVVERSTINPTVGSNPAPLDSTGISGNAATGINVATYYEPGVAWWRVRLTTLTGGSVNVSLSTSGE